MTVTTIPSYYPFIDVLADSLLREGLENLSETVVLLPNRRACRSLHQSLTDKAKGQAFILPKVMPFADMDPEDTLISPQWIGKEVLPPISPIERQAILMQMVLKYGQAIGERGYGQAAHAIQLARELARLIDQIHWEGLSFADLKDIVPEDYAKHWQVTLDFLKIITDFWPQILKEREASDPAAWRRDLILSYADQWEKNPPAHPIIAAGSTGSIPCTARLLDVVQRLPQGKVILPGIDPNLSDEEWENLEITHPQYGMAHLLKRFGCDRSDVASEVHLHVNPSSAFARFNFVSRALQPSVGQQWTVAPEVAEEAVKDLSIFEVKSPTEEAGLIALFMRQALEVPGKTVALVTPDRLLAERVKTELDRWDLKADDSAGENLVMTEEGCFLLLCAEAFINPDAIIPFLKVLNHTFVLIDQHFVAQFDKTECRNHCKLSDIKENEFLNGYQEALDPFRTLLAQEESSLEEIVEAFFHGIKFLSGEKIWQGEYRKEFADFWSQLMAAKESFPLISTQDFPSLLRQMMLAVTVRQPQGYHPRLFILGPLEARTLKKDLMILGGLNEGTWPPLTQTDPWLNRPMRGDYGLPLPERRIGLSAHDFVQAFCAKEVICTRALRINGTPTLSARWLQRLQTVLKASGQETSTDPSFWLHCHRLLDQPEKIQPCTRPAPRPPLAARPMKLSVTQIEMWMRDPYALYAKKVLKLESLDELEKPLSVAEKGILIHEILETFVNSKQLSLEALVQTGENLFNAYREQPEVMNFWWPRFRRCAAWFIEVESQRRQDISQSLTEATGKIVFETVGGPFTLTAKADRLDLFKSGEVEIIDYKTGGLPTKKEMEKGLAPQLTIEAALVEAGGFESIGTRPVKAVHYWRLHGSDPAGEIRTVNSTSLSKEALEGVQELVETYMDESVAYLAQPRPKYALRFNPYAHLSRSQEWMKGEVA